MLSFADQSCKLHNPLPPYAIPIDYYNELILVEHYSTTGHRQFSHFYYESGISEVVLQLKDKTHITGAKLFSNGIVFIADYKAVNIYTYLSDCIEEIFANGSEIVSFCIFEEQQDIWTGIIDSEGGVAVLKNWQLQQKGEILYQSQLVKDFDYGYPYVSSITPPFLSVSSDNFVHVLNFQS